MLNAAPARPGREKFTGRAPLARVHRGGMTSTAVRPRRLLVRHLAEMLAAMLVGMLVLGPLWRLPQPLADRPDVAAFLMATDMAVAMAVWMWHRGHGGAAIGEMTAAMYAPFGVLLVPWWTGLAPGGAVLLGGHLLMLPAMAWAVRRRIGEYTGEHPAAPRTGPLQRWPTLLALLCTVDNITDPRPLSPWIMLVLPAGYLVVGGLRRSLRPRRVLLVHLAALGAYVLLAVTAATAAPRVGLVLVGAGWLAHGAWDLWHYRRAAVVPRPYAEWCGVLDLVIGLSVLAVAVAGPFGPA
jgi:hypothetical protein